MSTKIKNSICIVTYNNAENIQRVLDSIFSNIDSSNTKVYIVDNKSTDETVSIVKNNFPNAIIIENAENKGFGHGHNTIISKLNSEYHFIVNPDIILSSNVVDLMAEYLDNNPDVTMVVPKFVYENGNEQFTPKLQPTLKYMLGGRFERFGNPFKQWRDEYTMRNKTITEPIEVGFCSGCFIGIRTDIFKKIGGFDERYFLYSEDADLTRMAKKFGRTVYVPHIIVTHLWERAYMKKPKYFLIQISSMIKYFYKWRKNGKYVGNNND